MAHSPLRHYCIFSKTLLHIFHRGLTTHLPNTVVKIDQQACMHYPPMPHLIWASTEVLLLKCIFNKRFQLSWCVAISCHVLLFSFTLETSVSWPLTTLMLVRITGELLCNVIRFRGSFFGRNIPGGAVFFSLNPVRWHAIFTSLFTDNFHFDHLIKALPGRLLYYKWTFSLFHQ